MVRWIFIFGGLLIRWAEFCTTATPQRCRRPHKVKIFQGRKKTKAQSRVPVTALIAWPISVISMESKVA